MKSYTDTEQSKKLTKILPIESADMYWWHNGQRYFVETKDHNDFQKSDIPCWSLAALLDVIPDNIKIDGHRWGLSIRKNSISYLGNITWDGQLNISIQSDNLVDACVEMIFKLHEQNIL